jgi:hypothetical protein
MMAFNESNPFLQDGKGRLKRQKLAIGNFARMFADGLDGPE